MGSPPPCDPLSPLYPYRVPSVPPWGHQVFTKGPPPTVTPPVPSMSPLVPTVSPCRISVPIGFPLCPLGVTMGSPPHCDPLAVSVPTISPRGPYCVPLSPLCPYRVPLVVTMGSLPLGDPPVLSLQTLLQRHPGGMVSGEWALGAPLGSGGIFGLWGHLWGQGVFGLWRGSFWGCWGLAVPPGSRCTFEPGDP